MGNCLSGLKSLFSNPYFICPTCGKKKRVLNKTKVYTLKNGCITCRIKKKYNYKNKFIQDESKEISYTKLKPKGRYDNDFVDIEI
tara:strand:- start:1829 stop:2083 length:255 start_codon:yes stop_codon:yes gene_type:complete